MLRTGDRACLVCNECGQDVVLIIALNVSRAMLPNDAIHESQGVRA